MRPPIVKVELDGADKTFPNGRRALRAASLAVESGEYFAVIGPSGSGKSTLLRLIAGLESPTSGRIKLDGADVTDRPPWRRDLALVFQNPVLYPHLDVFENIAFGLRARGWKRRDLAPRVEAAAARLGLADRLRDRPSSLSGGMRQRVALGRALARDARLILLDEPLASLDVSWRSALRDDLRALARETGATFLHVTHDQPEAFALADRIAVILDGRLAQVGTWADLYDRPAHRDVAAFVGDPPMNLIECDDPRTGRRAILGARAEDIRLGADVGDVAGPSFPATVRALEPRGADCIARLAMPSGEWSATVPREAAPPLGSTVATVLPGRVRWFDPATGAATA